MDKRSVKTQTKTEKALFELMQHDNFSDISITNIANQAGISRMAFYRNYSSKEDILNKFIQKEYDQFITDISQYNLDKLERLLEVYFGYFRDNPQVLSAIVNAAIEGLALEKQSKYLNDFFRLKIRDEQPSQYEIAYYSGAIFSSLLYWRKTDYKRPAKKFADQLAKKIRKDLQEKNGETIV
ncbi:TetR/AcrR family transcriptional regulator [Liquorilactobacillus hordei]|uniref:TetR family transcriptional regulator n=1 Tax=Liquorilactobacillus hordei TaxID=468911 RepID=A0A3S6QMC3_9LACO|nr:TetR/AcrR family transcriptional regulator [Liquorilactobacillus hordei]AUJ29102.1 TetR family transcriptional regulator [Liquorilactobacillus hordei]